ncbi:class I SAM-dependent methyltransferase [Bradyrhizobium sp. STM 3562]|uniref:class I SAM-dependent methyltransferase n=1 Tax=Bradyrhizobium sp. STM 3562 TaxID=578924 RepID=UPI00388F3CF7
MSSISEPGSWSLFSESLATRFRIRPGYAIQALHYLNAELAQLSSSARVADIGAGTGIFTRQIAQFVSNAAVIVGIEPSEGMRKLAAMQSSTRPIKYIAGSAEELPRPHAPYDAVTAAMAAHRFNRPIFFNLLPTILRPGGLIAFIDNLPRHTPSKLHDDYLTLQERYVPSFRRGMNTDIATGGYAFFDLAKELREHGGFKEIRTLQWDNDHYVDEATFLTFANSSTISLRVIDQIGKAEFDEKIKKLYLDSVNDGCKTELTYTTKLIVATLKPA